MAPWGQFAVLWHASWPQHVTDHHFPRLAPRGASGRPTVYNTSHSACCSSMKCLFIGTIGVQRVICLFWMRSGGFDKVSWIKALEGWTEGQVTGAAGGKKGDCRKTGSLVCCWWPNQTIFQPSFFFVGQVICSFLIFWSEHKGLGSAWGHPCFVLLFFLIMLLHYKRPQRCPRSLIQCSHFFLPPFRRLLFWKLKIFFSWLFSLSFFSRLQRLWTRCHPLFSWRLRRN